MNPNLGNVNISKLEERELSVSPPLSMAPTVLDVLKWLSSRKMSKNGSLREAPWSNLTMFKQNYQIFMLIPRTKI